MTIALSPSQRAMVRRLVKYADLVKAEGQAIADRQSEKRAFRLQLLEEIARLSGTTRPQMSFSAQVATVDAEEQIREVKLRLSECDADLRELEQVAEAMTDSRRAVCNLADRLLAAVGRDGTLAKASRGITATPGPSGQPRTSSPPGPGQSATQARGGTQ